MSFGSSDESTWIVAGWAFRQVVDDLKSGFDLSRPLAEVIENAEHLHFLQVDALPEPLKRELVSALTSMGRGIL